MTASAKKFTNQVVGPILAQNMSADELRTVAAYLESPAREKFDKLVPQLESAVAQKVQPDVAAQMDKEIHALEEAVGTKIRIAATEK